MKRIAIIALMLLMACSAKQQPTYASQDKGISEPLVRRSGPTTEAACNAVGGKWGEYGMSHSLLCDLPTKDAGKECKTGKDCESKLCVRNSDASAHAGKCFDRTVIFGCHALYPGTMVCID